MSFLTAVLKKTSDDSEDENPLSQRVKILTDKLVEVSNAVALLATAIKEQNMAINELYAVQATILKQMKSQGANAGLPELNKTKSDKPN